MPKYVSRESLVQAMIHDLGLSGKDAQDAVTLVFNELTDCLGRTMEQPILQDLENLFCFTEKNAWESTLSRVNES
ncbi:hypothetical protein [Faecalibaculum rodentium]|uniref:hypothetical protein n=1 Tax=Faecalibaculum rodentium TaxID=1702221 RepID=UPI0025A9A2F3|nr:hypothetical protein [Faecalibaculum rodentium]